MLGWLKNLPWKEITGAIIGIVGWIWAWIQTNKDKIQAIVIRIEKDSQDGWTSQEKEDLAVELFFKEIYPMLPWYVKMIPNALIEKMVRNVIREICEHSHKLKGLTPVIK